jgi:hypothetical protein
MRFRHFGLNVREIRADVPFVVLCGRDRLVRLPTSGGRMAQNVAADPRFECSGCGWRFATKWQLLVHRIVSRGRW